MKRVKLTYKDNKFVVVDLDTNKEMTNVTGVSFRHPPGEQPVCIIQTEVVIKDYLMEMNLNENS